MRYNFVSFINYERVDSEVPQSRGGMCGMTRLREMQAKRAWRAIAATVGTAAVFGVAAPDHSYGAPPSALGVEISDANAKESILSIRGDHGESRPTGNYAVTTAVTQVPCPGPYRFLAEGEDQSTGSVTTYSAAMVLSRFRSQPQGLTCGEALPRAPGQASLVLRGGDAGNPLRLSGRRGGFGDFVGVLRLSRYPRCDVAYELRSQFKLQGWVRTFTYEARFYEAVLTYSDNVTPPFADCK
jgi:hypothetical protein